MEIVVTGIEFPDVIQAEPPVIAGTIETGGTDTRRAKLSVLLAARNVALSAPCLVAAMEPVSSHAFHMATDTLEGKT